ncbi:hypothetical protein TWF694_007394 [Orbilia ellipsospora]|uniref:Rubisco LSMT substrate-binding domain-containing protein n=1 Tax=Orbilia ellipsospora TaxID=2528407 RepID=A0AAV9XHP1_9PEZI
MISFSPNYHSTPPKRIMSETAIADWFSRNGAQIHPSLKIIRSDCGELVIASSENIRASTTILSIPSDSILTLTNSPLSTIIPELSEKAQWPALIITVMYEASKLDSKWRAYLDSLPKQFDTLMYWTSEELQELDGSAVINKIGKEESEMWYSVDFQKILNKYGSEFEGVDVSLEAFHRVGSWIMAFSSDLEKPADAENPRDEDEMDEDDIEYDALDSYKAMVPFAHLIPSDCDLANCELETSESAVSFVTVKDIPANSTLYVDPGPLPRSDLLRRVGSYPQSATQHDVVEIDSTLIISVAGKALSDAARESRIDKLVEEEILEDSYDIEADGGIPSEILYVIQGFIVDDGIFQSYVQQEKFPKAKKDAITRDVILEVIEKRREMYRTTVDDDVALLNSDTELAKRKKMAVEVRLGEKEILKRMEDIVKSWGDSQVEGSGSRKRIKMR